ncbi:phosphatase PAP2 family protein [Mesoterricola silvestris]|uniref:Acid phosphatase n=1 Tax=Mesoterricola silvestris TaxID=2927979 RepID=A0AA48GML7_9BACT|nr:phosphatase PAP2 family protein [Mesoterricola silvestris]BDU74202.1 acid phosphatase [Mesoterricola silvestris]
MQRSHLVPFLTLALACAALAPLPAATPDWVSVVGLYPQPGTPDALQDLGVTMWLQHSRTQADVSRALADAHPGIGCFASLLDETFDISAHPLTEALMAQARGELLPILESLKGTFDRPRPYQTFPAITPAVPLEATPSYPSSHAAVGVLYARILAQFVPAHGPALLERGRQLGDDRVMAGVHWPSDVEAGQRLGRAFANWWISQPANRQLIVEACGKEWRGGR